MYNSIAFDLETLGTTPGSIILSIGAVPFNIETGEVGDDKFYCNIEEESCRAFGLTESEDTVAWWNDPAQAKAKSLLVDNKVSLGRALDKFAEWLPPTAEAYGLWSRGYFDEELLGAAYRATNQPEPWHYRAPRDARTFTQVAYDAGYLFAVADPEEYIRHYALDDAWFEAKLVSAAYHAVLTRGGRDGRIPPDAKRLLGQARDEIISLRVRLEATEPKAHAYDTLAQYARLTAGDGPRGMGVDVAWMIKQAIERDDEAIRL